MKVVSLRPSAWRDISGAPSYGRQWHGCYWADGDRRAVLAAYAGGLVGLVAVALVDRVVYFCSRRARVRPCRAHNPLSFSSAPHDPLV